MPSACQMLACVETAFAGRAETRNWSVRVATAIRRAAVAGTWYPGTAAALSAAVDRHLASTDAANAELRGDLAALIAPHAGLVYSGPVAAHAYRLLRGRAFDVVVLAGPSHFVGF